MRLALNFARIDPSKGGAETYVIDLCRSLVRAGHDVDVFAESWQPGALPPEVRPIRVAATGRTRGSRIWSFARNSEAAIRRSDYDCTVGFINTYAHDVIIPQGGVHAGSLRANAQRFRNPILRGLYLLGKRLNPKYALYGAIERRQYAASRRARVVAVSHMVRRHLQEHRHVPSERIHVIPNAIDVGRVRLEQPGAVRCAFRSRLGLEPTDVVGLFVGHNFALKGLRPLLKALAERSAAGGKPIHLLVGGGGRVEAYGRHARAQGLGDAVHFLGYHPDIRECYAASDFFVLPSYYDPCSLVVLEALAFGLPVITTKQNGAGELIADGREGYVLNAPDALGELVAALDRMTEDAHRAAMARAAAELGAKQTFDRHVEALVRVFEEVAATRDGHDSHGPRGGSRPHGHRSKGRTDTSGCPERPVEPGRMT
ncbi:Lipopolysaccharide core biosynthesis protein RfaG [Aquisphaera giovannonii]|uniref:Lipopolysaccharide core biosynthesis protein RfaG n=1 Tax=Aquisphaera giovannonii TaxID=406548 RepID=A0A5B9W9V9_9BACT|nr:glycosyltransferase family 4 protein [Aquisphaera giovannonii]QEH37362.1 Lipopolysaccharide core biosynthesis protein RfaG [Aquisphaera giovannonii]